MPTTSPTAAHPAQSQPREKNLNSDEATKRIAPEPLPADDPEVTGAGPVVDDSNKTGAPAAVKKRSDTIDERGADEGAADEIDTAEDDNGGIGRDNKGVAP